MQFECKHFIVSYHVCPFATLLLKVQYLKQKKIGWLFTIMYLFSVAFTLCGDWLSGIIDGFAYAVKVGPQ